MIKKNPLILGVIYGVCSLLSMTAGYAFVLDYCSVHAVNIWLLGITALLVFALVVLFMKLLLAYKDKPQIVFLLIAAPATCAFAFFILPDRLPDEIWHAYKIIDIFGSFNGGELIVPAVLEQSVLPDTYAELSAAILSADPSDTVAIDRNIGYAGFLYIIPGVVSLITQAIGVNPFFVIIIARLVNAGLFLVAGYWIIKLIPFGKSLMMIYLLTPMVIQQEASCSADVLTNVIALLFVVCLLRMRFSSEKITRLQVIVSVALLVLVVLSKIAYVPLVLLYFLFLPRLKNRNMKIALVSGTAVVALLGLVGLRLIMVEGTTIGYMVELLFSPRECAAVVVRTLYYYGEFYCTSFLGAFLGNLNIGVWKPAIFLYGALLVSAVFVSHSGETFSFKRGEKIFIMVVFCIMMVLIIISMRQWAIEASGLYHVIEGVQGRYFIPFAILPLLALIDSKSNLKRENYLVGASAVIVFVLLCSTVEIVRFFA